MMGLSSGASVVESSFHPGFQDMLEFVRQSAVDPHQVRLQCQCPFPFLSMTTVNSLSPCESCGLFLEKHFFGNKIIISELGFLKVAFFHACQQGEKVCQVSDSLSSLLLYHKKAFSKFRHFLRTKNVFELLSRIVTIFFTANF